MKYKGILFKYLKLFAHPYTALHCAALHCFDLYFTALNLTLLHCFEIWRTKLWCNKRKKKNKKNIYGHVWKLEKKKYDEYFFILNLT